MAKISVLGVRNFPADYGGIETACEHLFGEIAKKGHKITFYCRNNKNSFETKEFNGIKVVNLPTIELKGLGTFFHTFISSIAATFSDAEILHYHAQGPALFSIIPKIFSPGKKIVFTCHGIDWQRDKWGKIAKIVIKSGEKVSALFTDERIMVSNALNNYYKEVYNVESSVLSNGVIINEPVPAGEICEKFSLIPNKYLVFVGRLVPEKAVDLLISVFKSTKSPLKLVIVGDSPETPDYIKKIKQLAEGDERIIFTSTLKGRVLQEVYSNAGGYISLSKLEGNPITVLEAMSYAKPVILSDIPPHRETLSFDNKAGILVNNQDFHACKQAINNFSKLSGEDLKNMGNKSLKIVQNNFDWYKIAEETEKIYINLLNK